MGNGLLEIDAPMKPPIKERASQHKWISAAKEDVGNTSFESLIGERLPDLDVLPAIFLRVWGGGN